MDDSLGLIELPKNVPRNGTIAAGEKLTFVTSGIADWRYVLWGVKLDVYGVVVLCDIQNRKGDGSESWLR